jgi:hypothetical protein
MPDYVAAIANVRDSVVGIMRIHTVKKAAVKKGKQKPPRLTLAFVGTGFCIVADRLIFTAHHVFNEGKQRDFSDRFYAFYAPNNGQRAYHREVVAFPHEDSTLDMAVFEIAPAQGAPVVAPTPITFSPIRDGSPVLTYGFPAPAITGATLDQQGGWAGGNIFLMSHGNEGIVSSQYQLNGALHYELNVGWHHGESGGPIFRVTEPVAAFAVMQGYRNIQTPHGVVAGPHLGRALSAADATLRRLGARIIA